MNANCHLAEMACTGCTACASVCPQRAISMRVDTAGFLRPAIDYANCIACGLCRETCPTLHPAPVSQRTTAFAAYAKDVALLSRSSSGALFPLLAGRVLAQGGIVFGAAFDEDFAVRHIGVETAEELPRLCSSKYVQSDLGDTFQQVQATLRDGHLVYFSGTPCQAAGLRAFLKRDYDNLITQDIVCHSAPSPQVWADYKHALEAAHGGKMTDFSFRYKKSGWERYYIRAAFDNGSEYLCDAAKDPYQRGFLKGLYSRPSCYTCPFKGIERVSDITLADFWGVKALLPEAHNPAGTSLVLLHSEKARRLLSELAAAAELFPVDAAAALTWNAAALVPSARPKRYAYFQTHYAGSDFTQLVSDCCKPTAGEKTAAAWQRSVPYRSARRLLRIVHGGK